jgi:hypothetical protein
MKNLSIILYLFTIIVMITISTCHSTPQASTVILQDDEVTFFCTQEQKNDYFIKVCNGYAQLQQNYELLNKNYTEFVNKTEEIGNETKKAMFRHPITTAILFLVISTVGIIETQLSTFNMILACILIYKINKN